MCVCVCAFTIIKCSNVYFCGTCVARLSYAVYSICILWGVYVVCKCIIVCLCLFVCVCVCLFMSMCACALYVCVCLSVWYVQNSCNVPLKILERAKTVCFSFLFQSPLRMRKIGAHQRSNWPIRLVFNGKTFGCGCCCSFFSNLHTWIHCFVSLTFCLCVCVFLLHFFMLLFYAICISFELNKLN